MGYLRKQSGIYSVVKSLAFSEPVHITTFAGFFFLFFKDYSERYHSYTYIASPEEFSTSLSVVFAQRLGKTQLYPVTPDGKL